MKHRKFAFAIPASSFSKQYNFCCLHNYLMSIFYDLINYYILLSINKTLIKYKTISYADYKNFFLLVIKVLRLCFLLTSYRIMTTNFV